MNRLLLSILIAALPQFTFADAETEKAVSEVQEMMKDPKFHQNAAKESKEAQQVEKHVKDLAGNPENEQEIYNLAADVLGNMKDMTPEQMNEFLRQAQKNPESFQKSWTPEQKRKLKELADRLPSSQKRKP
ncbi:MAG: hypothetical protein ACAH59_14000 [Pseudobdellovibrionaceae bacterium]